MKHSVIRLFFILLLPGFTERRYLAKPGIPVICYHGIFTGESRRGALLAISREQLNNQLKSLYDSGYHTILPDQLYDHLINGEQLPPKPIIITFDDTRSEHIGIAAPLLEQYGFRAVFFVMTVPIGKLQVKKQYTVLLLQYVTCATHTYCYTI